MNFNPQSLDDDNLPLLPNALRYGFVELYHPDLHGVSTDDNPPEIGQYLVELIPYYEDLFPENAERLQELIYWFSNYPRPEHHPHSRGYSAWVNRVRSYGTLELIKTSIQSETGILVAVLYTFLIRRIQRRWRTYYALKKKNARKSIAMRNWHSRLTRGVHPMSFE